MNTTVGLKVQGNGAIGRHPAVAGVLGIAAAIAIATLANIGGSGGLEVAPSANSQPGVSSLSSGAVPGDSQLVPDEYKGGYREPKTLRERLQAERGEFRAP
jgi:hypothetical protein